ncbi:MAG: sugar transferase [Candidatus Taylorbacteria bacterium]|nr:sugar transferase [Candidatus Taylorbacteria bacterium]
MTRFASSKAALILVAGDLIAYVFSLILTLAIRYGELPPRALLAVHLPAFSILFLLFLLVGFSAGMYDKQSSFMRGRIGILLAKVQSVDIFVGIAFFYFAPVIITPKANLFIYFIISTILLFLWRLVMFPVVNITGNQTAVLIGSSNDIHDLFVEINGNARYGLTFKENIVPGMSVDQTVSSIGEAVKRSKANIIVANLHDKTIESAMSFLYSLIFSGVQIVDASKLYEVVFDRIPLSLVGDRWLVENAGTAFGGRRVYDSTKRLMDIAVSIIGLAVTAILYPFVLMAVKIEDGGSLFIKQDRIGKNGKLIHIIKFRSMSADDGGKYGSNGSSSLKITKVGRFIRMTRIDEFPQFWNILKGDLSLIGPRPELPPLVNIYNKEIRYYNVRHLIKPGLSGWAQIYHAKHPHHGVDKEETYNKLSYDLYYVKNRSLSLDFRIALQTVHALMSRQGV